MYYQVKAVSELCSVSIRTLHYYDKIGLLKPDTIAENGYRVYNDASLERLQQILFFKELGFSLFAIKGFLDHPGFDRQEALLTQKKCLEQKKIRLENMIETVNKTLNAVSKGKKLSQQEMFIGMDTQAIEAHKQKYAKEVKDKWGQTNAYQESQKKTANYSPTDWERIHSQTNEIYARIVAGRPDGIASPQVQAAVADLRQSICENYYNCTPEIFGGLGEMYASDPRFEAFYEKIEPGLALFLSEAIAYYCAHLD
jgi:DNA-binding transcriptional MerR regulator